MVDMHVYNFTAKSLKSNGRGQTGGHHGPIVSGAEGLTKIEEK